MKLYLVKQDANRRWHRYDAVVVAANSKKEARSIYPEDESVVLNKNNRWVDKKTRKLKDMRFSNWANFEDITCKCIGEASDWYTSPMIILASYNAG